MDKVNICHLILLISSAVELGCFICLYNRFEKLKKDFDNHLEIKKLVYKIRWLMDTSSNRYSQDS